jgi:hypothetical protein
MNLPNVNYNPKDQNRLRSSIDLSTQLENRDHLTCEQKRTMESMRARKYPNQQFNKSNISRDFVLPDEVKKLKDRVSSTRQVFVIFNDNKKSYIVLIFSSYTKTLFVWSLQCIDA